MTNLNVLFVVLVVQVVVEPKEGVEVLEYLVLQSCSCHTLFVLILLCCIMSYFILLNSCVCNISLYSYFISYSLFIVTTFTLYFIYEDTLCLN